VHIFALVTLAILVVPIGCRLARIPSAFGLIVAGVLLGPHALAILERDATMRLFGTVGLLYIMFQVGLEIDLNQFLRHRYHSLVFGSLTFAIPMAIGVTAGMVVLGMTPVQAVLLGSMFASHTLLTFPTVSRLGLVKTRVVTTVVGGTMLTDSAALLVLAAIAASTRGTGGTAFWLRFAALALAATGLILWGLPRLGRWFYRTAATDDTVEYVFALVAVFACAVLVQAAGLEPVIGAFLAGLALNRLVPENGVLMNRIRFVGDALFIPFFLISIGMLVNLRLPFETHEGAAAAVVMILVALSAKWLAAELSRRLLGYDTDEGGLLLGLSVNQAAATLAAVMVGFDLGLFSETVVTGAVAMILVTCSVGAWLTDRFAVRCAEHQTKGAGAAPLTGTMDRIMVPLANPSTASHLMGLALLLRRHGSYEPIYPLAVVQEGPEDTPGAVAAAERMLGGVVAHAVAAQVPVIPITRVELNVATGICRAMTDFRTSLAVIGWNGEVFSLQRVFGRVLDQLLDQSQQMLLVYRATVPINTVQRLIVLLPPLVGRHPGIETVQRCLEHLAAQIGASLHLLHAADGDHGAWPGGRTRPRLTAQALSSWSAAVPALTSLQPGAADALVLVGSRRGGLGWQPALDRLPRLLAVRFAEANLIVAYPPEARTAAAATADGAADMAAHETAFLVRPEDVVLGLDGLGLDAAIDRLLRQACPLAPESLSEGFARARLEEGFLPLELTPGAVLLHAHVEGGDALPQSRVLVAINRQGFVVGGCTRPAECLFLLLSPADQPAEAHLRKLAAIAQRLRDPGRLPRLLAAETPAAAAAVLG
jgi:Kef-type K+ transport system membrane component KefB